MNVHELIRSTASIDAVLAAQTADPATSRTARLLRSGRGKMAKKLAEEAVEVVIDAMHGDNEAVVRESADLLYNLVVLWVSAGINPEDVWAEMDRRERLFGIAEKLPKGPRDEPPDAAPRRKVVALAAQPRPQAALSASAERRAGARRGQSDPPPVSKPAMLRRLYDWCIAAAGKPHAPGSWASSRSWKARSFRSRRT